jgi:hypothetical protein
VVKKDELRPYGPKGERICFDCGMKDEATTDKMIGIKLFGDDGCEKKMVGDNEINFIIGHQS